MYRFGTVVSGSTAEIVKETQPKMYEYMKQFMHQNVSDGIKAVKEKLNFCLILNYSMQKCLAFFFIDLFFYE
jgi:hypothetical protein